MMQKLRVFTRKLFNIRKLQFWLALFMACMLSLVNVQGVFTQQQVEDDWTQPVNLTNSGSTSDPIVLVDSANSTHIIWSDAFEGYFHIQTEEDGTWTEPHSLFIPFDHIQPYVISGPNDLIYTFWLEDGRLLYSRVISTLVGLSVAWESVRVLSSDTLAFDVFIDSDQDMHVVYLKQSDDNSQQSGIYYLQKPASRGWTSIQTIYTSQYFRTMQEDQSHVSVAVGYLENETDGEETTDVEKQIFVAWDEPFAFRSVLSSSPEGDYSWTVPTEVDSLSNGIEENKSFEPELTFWNDTALLIWKEKLSETTCEIRYTVATGAQEWGEAKESFSSTIGCPSKSGFLVQHDDLLLWHAVIGNQVILTAWDGHHWSEPRTELELTGFRDPASGQTLSLGSRHMFYVPSTNKLLVVGCDENGNRDVWLTQKSLNDVADWFLPYSSWSSIQEVDVVPYGVEDINTTTDLNGNIHTLWTPKSTSNSASHETRSTARYSLWDGANWSDPSVVLSDDGGLNQLSAVMNNTGDLMAIWRKETGCQISFSRVSSAVAFNIGEWMEPVILPTPIGVCSSPILAVGEDQAVYAAYAVAINEGRGIYFNHSTNGGRTWEAPTQIFDAQAASWEMVDQPVFAIYGERLHILWQRKSPLDPDFGQGFGYAYSDDDGVTWNPEEITTEQPMLWAGLAVSQNGFLVRVWQQDSSEYSIITTQTSPDGGQTWTPAISVENVGEVVGTPELITDPQGGIHFLHVIRESLGQTTLRHWIMSNDGWTARESLSFGYEIFDNNFDLTSNVTQHEQLMVIYTGFDSENDEKTLESVISQIGVTDGYWVGELGDSGLSSSMAESTDSIEEAMEPISETQKTVIPTVIPDFATRPDERSFSFANWIGPVLGAVLAMVIVGSVLVIQIFKKKT